MAANTMYSTVGTYTETTPSKTGVLYRGNVQAGTGTSANSNTDASMSLGSYIYGWYLSGIISEVMLLPRALSAADRTAIYEDEQNYFSSQ